MLVEPLVHPSLSISSEGLRELRFRSSYSKDCTTETVKVCQQNLTESVKAYLIKISVFWSLKFFLKLPLVDIDSGPISFRQISKSTVIIARVKDLLSGNYIF